MAYTPQSWADGASGSTPINASRLTHIEDGVKDADNRLVTMQTTVDGKAPIVHTHPVADLTATGTASSSTYLRGDGTWATPAGGSAVTSVNGKTGVVSLTAADVSAQPSAAELTAIAALIHANDTVLQTKAGAWVASTPTQVKTDLALAKSDVGLGSVDNTADTAKPVSVAQQTALDSKATKLTPTATKTTAYTAVAGDLVVCDTTTAALTVTMPAATAGAIIAIRKDDASANAVTIARNGTDVFGAVNTVTSLTLDVPRQVVTLIGVAGAWIPSAGIPTPRTLPDLQVFTTSGTWTKPAGATRVTVFLLAGGGGGGSGARRASATATSGGAGGAGGGYTTLAFRAAELGSTETVTVGTAGAGGAAITVNDTNGNTGSGGGSTSFGVTRARANGGSGGAGGSTAASSGGSSGAGGAGGSGGSGGVIGAAGVVGGRGTLGGPGGASGAGVSATPAAFAGGVGGTSLQMGDIGGGTAGPIDGNGGAGTAFPAVSTVAPGGGGGGGGSSITVAGGAGGAGGAYGAGGGGGGSALNGSNSGAGGNGGVGVVVVISD